MDQRTKFLQIYANLPLKLRQEVVIVIDGEPLTWNAAWIEISNSTKKSDQILKKLVGLGILV